MTIYANMMIYDIVQDSDEGPFLQGMQSDGKSYNLQDQ